MGVVIIDGNTIHDFVNDESQFTKSVELRTAFKSMRLIEAHFRIDVSTPPKELKKLYNSIFDKFDGDGSGTVDKEEFRTEMKKIMLAIANGLGSFPIPMVLEDDSQSLLQKPTDLDAFKTATA